MNTHFDIKLYPMICNIVKPRGNPANLKRAARTWGGALAVKFVHPVAKLSELGLIKRNSKEYRELKYDPFEKSDQIIQRLRISMTVSASRDSGFADNPGETHLKCNSVEPS